MSALVQSRNKDSFDPLQKADFECESLSSCQVHRRFIAYTVCLEDRPTMGFLAIEKIARSSVVLTLEGRKSFLRTWWSNIIYNQRLNMAFRAHTLKSKAAQKNCTRILTVQGPKCNCHPKADNLLLHFQTDKIFHSSMSQHAISTQRPKVLFLR